MAFTEYESVNYGFTLPNRLRVCVCVSTELVGALDAQKIAGVACGQAHSLALSEQGQVFAWGSGESGQLGLGTAEEAVRVPR